MDKYSENKNENTHNNFFSGHKKERQEKKKRRIIKSQTINIIVVCSITDRQTDRPGNYMFFETVNLHQKFQLE